MKKTIVFLLLVIFIGNFLFPFLASAGEYQGYGGTVRYEGLVPCGKSEKGPDEDEGVTKPCQLCHLFVMLNGIINFVLIDILPWVVILMILIAGVMFYFAGGNPSLLLQAKKLITSVVIGLTIIFCSYLIIGTVLTVLGVQHWTTLDQWAGSGVFIVDCPIEENGSGTQTPTPTPTPGTLPGDYDDPLECEEAGYYWHNGECKEGEPSQLSGSGSGIDPYSQELLEITANCSEIDQIAVGGECIPTDANKTEVVGSGNITADDKGYTCTFKGKIESQGAQLTKYYTPEGTAKVICVPE